MSTVRCPSCERMLQRPSTLTETVSVRCPSCERVFEINPERIEVGTLPPPTIVIRPIAPWNEQPSATANQDNAPRPVHRWTLPYLLGMGVGWVWKWLRRLPFVPRSSRQFWVLVTCLVLLFWAWFAILRHL